MTILGRDLENHLGRTFCQVFWLLPGSGLFRRENIEHFPLASIAVYGSGGRPSLAFESRRLLDAAACFPFCWELHHLNLSINCDYWRRRGKSGGKAGRQAELDSCLQSAAWICWSSASWRYRSCPSCCIYSRGNGPATTKVLPCFYSAWHVSAGFPIAWWRTVVTFVIF